MHTGLPTLILCTMHHVNSAAQSPSHTTCSWSVGQNPCYSVSLTEQAGQRKHIQKNQRSPGSRAPAGPLPPYPQAPKGLKLALQCATHAYWSQQVRQPYQRPRPGLAHALLHSAPATCSSQLAQGCPSFATVVGFSSNQRSTAAHTVTSQQKERAVARPTAMPHTTQPIMQCSGHDTRSPTLQAALWTEPCPPYTSPRQLLQEI